MKIKINLFDRWLNKKEKEQKSKLAVLWTVIFVLSIVLFILAAPIFAYEYIYSDQIYVGVKVSGLDLGGLRYSEAVDKLNQFIDSLKNRGLNFSYNNKIIKIETSVISPTDPDLSYEILEFDVAKMVDQAYAYGRSGDSLNNLVQQVSSIMKPKELAVVHRLKDRELISILKDNFSQYELTPQEAGIVFQADKIQLVEEKAGQIFNYDLAVNLLKKEINLESIKTIPLTLINKIPTLTKKEIEANLNLVNSVVAIEKIKITSKDKFWDIPNAEFKSWLIFEKKNNQIGLAFDQEKLAVKLQQIATEVNVSASDAKFVMEEGRVKEFTPSRSGLEVDLAASGELINAGFFASNRKTEFELVIKESQPQVLTESVNDLGIKEIIGIGESDFSGSHTNRIKNIENASAFLNGVLVKPGEEFSLVTTLGDIDAAHGYWPEYVIKGDRTIKEYGGGLCQIGTTTFRAALYSGLPVTERRPHSYIVNYYRPIGMDATIYGPHPDLRFVNDTGHYILFQTRIEGTKLTFEFWGTKDGRQVEITDPVLYNRTSPGPAKLIETTKLEPGKKNCIETARNGADTYFYRYLTMPGQEKKEEVWRSHYQAWEAICEIGVEKLSTDTATSNTDAAPVPVDPGSN